MENYHKTVITAIICLTVIELMALYQGIDGTLMSLMIAAIAGLGGWVVPQPKIKPAPVPAPAVPAKK